MSIEKSSLKQKMLLDQDVDEDFLVVLDSPLNNQLDQDQQSREK
jgi:hypothetical protein